MRNRPRRFFLSFALFCFHSGPTLDVKRLTSHCKGLLGRRVTQPTAERMLNVMKSNLLSPSSLDLNVHVKCIEGESVWCVLVLRLFVCCNQNSERLRKGPRAQRFYWADWSYHDKSFSWNETGIAQIFIYLYAGIPGTFRLSLSHSRSTGILPSSH